jgi:hypothetical protein
MAETEVTTPVKGGATGTWSLVLGLFSVACAVPPAFFFFIVPGFWTHSLNLTLMASPGLGFLAVVLGAVGLRGGARSRAKAGMALGIIAFIILAATAWRYHSLVSGSGG